MHGWLFKLMQFQAAGEHELKHMKKKRNEKSQAECVDRCRSDESDSTIKLKLKEKLTHLKTFALFLS